MRLSLPVLLMTLVVPSSAPADWTANGVPVCVAPGYQETRSVLGDGSGGAFVLYNQNGGDLYLQRLTASGSIAPGWPSCGVPVCTAPDQQGVTASGQGMILDGEGGVIVAWIDLRTWSQTGAYEIYAVRITGEGEVAPGWQVNGTPVAVDLPGRRSNPEVVTDGADGAIIAWGDPRSGKWDVYALRLLSDGTRAPGWPENGLLIGTGPESIGDPLIMEDGQGGAYVNWWADGQSTIAMVRVTAEGQMAPGWPVNGKVVASGPGRRGGASMVPDHMGGIYLLWVDLRSWPGPPEQIYDYYDFYARRITDAGEPVAGWPLDGVPVCTAPGLQIGVSMISDGMNGLLAAWSDHRDISNADVYALRLLPDGSRAPGWPENGTPVAGGPGYQLIPHLAPDGAGGAYVSYINHTDGRELAFAHRFTAAGAAAPGWNPAGTQLADVPGRQSSARIAADGLGGAIVAWTDGRVFGELDVYAQKLVPDGPVAVQVSLVSAVAEPGRVVLTWFVAEGAGFMAAVERRGVDDDWHRLATIAPDGTGRLVFEDRSVVAGARYGYRLVYFSDGIEVTSEETWVEIPARTHFALEGAHPNPSFGDLVAAFSLPHAGRATLALYDVAGRQVLSREVGSLGAGTHRLNLTRERRLPAGVYTLRLTQGEQRAGARAVVIR